MKRVTVTMPQELYEVAQVLCLLEHRTQSELFREALRRYAEVSVPVPGWQRDLLDASLTAHEAQPDDVISWDAVESRVRRQLAGSRA